MAHRILNGVGDLADFVRLLANLKFPITVEWVQGRDRTGDQNKLMWLWASETAEQRGDDTADEVQRQWKLHHGVPILREDSAEFREIYDSCLKPLPYPLKLKAMRFIPVTSEMKVPQMIRFLDVVAKECGERGIIITQPDDDLAAYQNRYRAQEAKAA